MKKQSIAGGFAILSICGLLGKVLSLIYVPVLKGILGGDGHGIYVATYGVFAYVYTICNSGLPNSISKLVAEEIELGNKRRAQRLFELSRLILIVVGILLSLIMFFFSTEIAQWMNYPQMDLALKVLSPAVIVTAVLSSYKGYFQAQRIMTPTGISQVLEQLVNVIFSLSVAALFIKSGVEKGVAGATVGTTLGAFAAILIMFYYYKKKNLKGEMDLSLSSKYRKNDFNLIKRILLTAAPLTFCAGLQNISFIVDPAQLSWRLEAMGVAESVINISYGNIGRYQSLINVPVAIAMALAVATLPVIAGKMAVGDKKSAKIKTDFVHKLCFLATVPCAFGMGVLAYRIASVFNYNSGEAPMLMFGSFIIVLMSLMQVQMAVIQGINKLFTITGITVLALIIKFVVNHFTIGMFGYLGVLIGNGTCFGVIIILGTITINKALDDKVKLVSTAAKPFVASITMGVVIFGLDYILMKVLGGIGTRAASLVVLCVCIPIGAGVYGIMILILKTLNQEEYEAMPGKIRRFIPKRFVK